MRLGSLIDRLKGSAGQSGGTSITDGDEYRAYCKRAAENRTVFATFRRAPVYVGTLEHVSREYGAGYVAAIQRDNPDLLSEQRDRYLANDRLGSPTLYAYEHTGLVSPVTLRYLKVVSDLRRLFGDLTGRDIVEIGTGYGGQCRLVTQYWAVASYTLIDLPPALALARRFLTTLGTSANIRYEAPDKVQPREYDLCVSNYAFSELARPVQRAYVDAVVSRSKRGYMTCNFISEEHAIDSMSAAELLALHSGSRWLPEEPLTHPNNAILVWGTAGSVDEARTETAS